MPATPTVPLLALTCALAMPAVVVAAPCAPKDIPGEARDRDASLYADFQPNRTTNFRTDRLCESLVDLIVGINAEVVSMRVYSDITVLGQGVGCTLAWAPGAVCMFVLCVAYFTCARTHVAIARASDHSSSS